LLKLGEEVITYEATSENAKQKKMLAQQGVHVKQTGAPR